MQNVELCVCPYSFVLDYSLSKPIPSIPIASLKPGTDDILKFTVGKNIGNSVALVWLPNDLGMSFRDLQALELLWMPEARHRQALSLQSLIE